MQQCGSRQNQPFAAKTGPSAQTGPEIRPDRGLRPPDLRGIAADCKSYLPGPFKGPCRNRRISQKRSGEDHVTIIEQGGGPAPQAADLIKETTTQTFVKDVIEES